MDPKTELEINKKLKEERDCSNLMYSPMIVKTIVYGAVGMICVATLGYYLAKIWPQ